MDKINEVIKGSSVRACSNSFSMEINTTGTHDQSVLFQTSE